MGLSPITAIEFTANFFFWAVSDYSNRVADWISKQARNHPSHHMMHKRLFEDDDCETRSPPMAMRLTKDGKRWLADLRAKQIEKLKEPALPDRQKLALEARAVARFGRSVTFADSFRDLSRDTVFPVIMKYTRGHTPPNPTLRDIGRSLGGGYAQEVEHLALAEVVYKGKGGRVMGCV